MSWYFLRWKKGAALSEWCERQPRPCAHSTRWRDARVGKGAFRTNGHAPAALCWWRDFPVARATTAGRAPRRQRPRGARRNSGEPCAPPAASAFQPAGRWRRAAAPGIPAGNRPASVSVARLDERSNSSTSRPSSVFHLPDAVGQRAWHHTQFTRRRRHAAAAMHGADQTN